MAGRRRFQLRGPVTVSAALGLFAGILMPYRATPRHRVDLPLPVLEEELEEEPMRDTEPEGAAAELAAPATTTIPKSSGPCPVDMILVQGRFCTGLAHVCKRYIDERMDRCGEFLPMSRCLGKQLAKRFCIDQYEYPNRAGEKPLLAVNWFEAGRLCEAQGKRLCTADEWTFACEGEGGLPYPYGYSRDREACNIDKPYIFPNDAAYANSATRDAEIARLDQREASGARASCVSPFGIFDMTGNVDEWVVLERGSLEQAPFKSALKGGYWGPVRNRCRPITATHNPWHSGYQIGFRCCSDPEPRADHTAGSAKHELGGTVSP